MSLDQPEPILNACPHCAQLLDVTETEPYSKIVCEHCNQVIRVRTAFHHFVLEEQIGTGGMSRVFRTTDTALSRPVALKILNKHCSSDTTRVSQFEREAKTTAAISHPNVVKVYSSGWDQGYFYIAMELVEGGSLDEAIRKHRRIPEARLLDIALQTAHGLRAASHVGLIHRDIKPGNILFAANGTAKIVDFGLALMLDRDVDDSGEIWATPFYVPPEKLNGGQEDHRSDIYSLGASLFHAVLGRPAFDADTNSIEELRRLKSHPVKILPEEYSLISKETARILLTCLERNPVDRYPNYDELIKHIEIAQQALKSPTPKKRKTKSKTPLFLAAGIALVAAVVAMIALKGPKAPSANQTGGPLIMDTDPLAANNNEITSLFQSARDALLKGEYIESRKEFQKIASQAPHPTANWSSFNAGLCALMSGDEPSSRGDFTQMGNISGQGPEMYNYFTKSSQVLASDSPPLVSALGNFNANSYQSMTLLAAGLKAWHMGDWRAASGYLRPFSASTPDKGNSWINQYKPLAAPYLEELSKLYDFPTANFGGQTPEQARETVARAKAAADSLKLPGPVKTAIASEIPILEERLVKYLAELESAADAEDEKIVLTEIEAFEAALKEVTPLCQQFQFSAAADSLAQKKFAARKHQKLTATHVTLLQQAEEFLKLLGEDLPRSAPDIALEHFDVGPPKAKLVGGSRSGLVVRVPNAVVDSPLPFPSIKARCLVELAIAGWARVSDSDEYYRRRELTIAFAAKSGQRTLATLLGAQLARESRAFRQKWATLSAAIKG